MQLVREPSLEDWNAGEDVVSAGLYVEQNISRENGIREMATVSIMCKIEIRMRHHDHAFDPFK